MAIVISGNGIDMGNNPVSNASQIDGTVINESGSNVRTENDSYSKTEVDGKIVGFKNYIINGDMRIAQRGETHTIIVRADGVYHLDRWCSTQLDFGGTQSVQKVNTTVNGANDVALRTYQVTACYNRIIQILDNDSSKSLRGKKMSVSFWYRAKGGITCRLQQRTDRQTFSSDFNTQKTEGIGTTIGVSSGLIADETWRYASFTTTVSSANGFFHLVFTQNPAADNYFEITKVQLEEGSVATPFENRPYGLELSLCQRYYEVVNVNEQPQADVFYGNWRYLPAVSFVLKRVMPTISILSISVYPNANTDSTNYYFNVTNTTVGLVDMSARGTLYTYSIAINAEL